MFLRLLALLKIVLRLDLLPIHDFYNYYADMYFMVVIVWCVNLEKQQDRYA